MDVKQHLQLQFWVIMPSWRKHGKTQECWLRPFYMLNHGRPSLRSSVITWNKMLQKELDHMPTVKTDAAAAFLASLEDPKLTSLGETEKKPPIEILPPGMPPLSAPPIIIKKAAAKPGLPNAAQTPGAPMNQGTPMAQGTPMNQSTPMAQGTPVAQGAPMAQAPPALAQSTDEVKPLEATTAPDNVEATAATSNAEATAAPGTAEATEAPVPDPTSSSPDAAAAPAPAADSSGTDALAVTPSDSTNDAPSTKEPETQDKPPSTEASPSPPPSISAV
ncbi:unnamed protein product [Triticum turgidum subsp. durum]|uniref:Uncharacterized protein n=1 Tax=Triticum turgidum subsp. durum TaxID=4567 RepID=A0A9R0RKQ9_TRITD|nr:unnamed protein product [Triticum turgidum subsp. durum]